MNRQIAFYLFLALFLMLGVLYAPSYAQTSRDSSVTYLDSGNVCIRYLPTMVPLEPIRYETEPGSPYVTGSPSQNNKYVIAQKQSRSLYSGYSVGSIPYSEGTSPSGARTYSIPIATSAGSHFPPTITLSYNSQAGDGIAGYGWSLSGLSAITLIGHTLHYNGTIVAPNVEGSDPAFALDGIPIVQSEESALQTAYPYTTARGNIHIKKYTTASGQVSYFRAIYPDGSSAIFGWPANSETKTSYPITQIENIDGEKIVFNYTRSGGIYLPTAIKYDYESNTNYQGKITFSYTDRTAHTKYYAGELNTNDILLYGITSYGVRDSLLASYHPIYTRRHSAYLMSSLSVMNGSEEMNPLEFTYAEEPQSADFILDCHRDLTTAFTSNIDVRDIRGKFIPGRYVDGLVSVPVFSTYTRCATYQQTFLGMVIAEYYEYGSGYPANQSFLIAPWLSPNYSTQVITAEAGFQAIEAVDIDYDGTDEIVKVNYTGFSGDYTTYRIKEYSYNETTSQLDSSFFDINIRGVVNDNGHKSPAQRVFYFGRFDDTNHLQLLTISYNKDFRGRDQDSYTTIVDLVTHSKSEYQLFDLAYGDEYKYLIYDLDGDGKTDVSVGLSDGSGYQHYTCNSSGQFSPDRTISGMAPGILTGIHYFADMNGDGYTDIIKAPYEWHYEETYPGYDEGSGEDPGHYLVLEYVSGGNVWDIYSFTGSDFVGRTCTAATRDIDDNFYFSDINSDGLADLIEMSDGTIRIFPNEDGNISSNNYITSSQSIPSGSRILPANDIVSGRESHFIALKDFHVYRYTFSEDRRLNRLVSYFEDSFGNIQETIYEKATTSSVYHKDPSHTYSLTQGFYSQSAPIPVIESIRRFSADSSLVANEGYEYFNSVFNNRGLGFCGFGKVRTKDYISGDETTTVFDPEKFGVPTSVSANKELANTPYSTITYTYDSHTTTYGKLNPRLTQSVAVDSLTGITTTTSYSYGDYDLPSSVTTTRQVGTQPAQSETVNYTYQHSLVSSKYVLGAVTQELHITNADANPDSSWRQKTVITYDDDFHPVLTKQYVGAQGFPEPLPHDPPLLAAFPPVILRDHLVSTTRRTFDSRGNVTSEKSAPYGATEFVGDTLVYDSNGRYLVSKTDALGHTTTYSGYNKFGKPTSVTDYRNRTTTYTYDSWGNLTQTSYPDGGVEHTTTAWGGDGLYTVTQTATGSPETITHYDALGREIKSGVKRFDGVWQWTNREYDGRGRLSRVSLPYRQVAGVTGPSYWNTYHYDLYDRPDSLCEASGRVTSWSYNGTSTTTVKDSIAITKTTDAMGRVVSVSDPGGMTTYALRDDGQPSSITAPGNVVTTFTYDDYGRQTQMVDPSLGTETDSYTWNADGSSQFTHTNRNGTVTTYKDKYGRTTQVQRANEFNTTYTYDTYGRLSAVSSTNSTGKQYTYDAYDRVATFMETVPQNKWLQKTYTYTTGSVLSSIAYTSQSGYITTETYTYANGHNTGITIPGTLGGNSITVWSLVSENDLGQPTEITTGGVSRTYGYTAFGLPTYRDMDGGYIQSFSYQFDPKKGNLLSRSGYLSDAESFGYDALNRLTSITKGNTTREIVYADNGNITSIDGVGTLIYGGGAGVSPYEVTGLTPEAGQPAYRQRTVTYNSFDRPSYVVENTFDYPEAHYTYNADGEKVFADIEHLDGILHWQYYAGGRYEYDNPYGTATERLYLGGDAYSAPMVLQRTGNGSWTLYNIGRDYQGSITSISDQDGGVLIAQYRYDPWGRLVNPATGTPYAPGSEPTLFLGRGYTSHEHLPWFGLINANARLYDPLLGRFLSPDPYVQDPDFSQNYNRYSYCLNNPLKYTDESGEVVGTTLAIAALIGGISNWLANGAEFSWKGLGYYWVGLHVGVFSALTGDWIAGLTKAAGVWAGALVGATTGAMTGAATSTLTTLGNNLVSGNPLDYGLGRAALSGALGGALSGAFSGAIKGYQYAKENGASPWTRRINSSEKTYERAVKEGIPIQSDETEFCYANVSAYADAGHGNHSVEDFLAANNYARGGDVSSLKTLSKAQLKIDGGMRELKNRLLNVTGALKYNPKMEILATIPGGKGKEHWVNVYKIVTSNRLSWFGGKESIVPISIGYWNPANGFLESTASIISLKAYLFQL